MATNQEPARIARELRKKTQRELNDQSYLITRCDKCARTYEGTFQDGRAWFRDHVCP